MVEENECQDKITGEEAAILFRYTKKIIEIERARMLNVITKLMSNERIEPISLQQMIGLYNEAKTQVEDAL